MKRQMGLSLSEVLISLFLASVIMTLLIQIYSGSKRQYMEAEKILTTGFDVQWLGDLLTDSISRAGFTPCMVLDQLQTVDQRNIHNNVRALYVENEPLQLIQIKLMNEHFVKPIKIQSPTQIVVPYPMPLNEKRQILIADCVHAEIHGQFHVVHRMN
ncbi:MAG: hypothetical protein ACRCXC_08285 [Legionella sp.]